MVLLWFFVSVLLIDKYIFNSQLDGLFIKGVWEYLTSFYKCIKRKQPNCVVNNRLDSADILSNKHYKLGLTRTEPDKEISATQTAEEKNTFVPKSEKDNKIIYKQYGDFDIPEGWTGVDDSDIKLAQPNHKDLDFDELEVVTNTTQIHCGISLKNLQNIEKITNEVKGEPKELKVICAELENISGSELAKKITEMVPNIENELMNLIKYHTKEDILPDTKEAEPDMDFSINDYV